MCWGDCSSGVGVNTPSRRLLARLGKAAEASVELRLICEEVGAPSRLEYDPPRRLAAEGPRAGKDEDLRLSGSGSLSKLSSWIGCAPATGFRQCFGEALCEPTEV